MKIAIDARFWGLENAGLGRYTINLIRELEKRDKKNTYFIILRKKYWRELKFQKNFQKVLLEARHYSVKEQILIPILLRRCNPDLVHFLHFNVPVLYRKKYLVTIHDILMHKSKGKDSTTLPLPVYFIKRLFYNLVFSSAVHNSSLIITPSKTIAEELQKYYSISRFKIKPIYEGFDKNLRQGKTMFNYKNLERNNYLIYVGNIYPHKNIRIAIKGLSLFNREEHRKLKLVIVTSKNIFRSRIEKYVKKEGIEDDLVILDHQDDKKLAELIGFGLAFIYPSLSEGFGLPGVEAMSLKTPLLASNIKVFKEVYGKNAIYFDPRSERDIKNAIKKIYYMSESDRNKITSKAFDFVDKTYSWSKMAKEIIKVYEDSRSI